jgi:hypothetical protein
MTDIDTLIKILDLTRWAPSGDNMQTWQFSVQSSTEVTIYCRDTRDHCVYDLHGHPSQIAFGALLETMAIAASGYGLRCDASRSGSAQEPVFQVRLVADASVRPSPLIDSIRRRTVQRRPLQTRPLSESEQAALQAAVGPDYMVQWLTGPAKTQAAWLMYRNARLRLTMPEAFETHRSIIEWDARHSEDKVPDQALGLDAMTVHLMRWAMHSWQRMRRVNQLLGTWSPRLQMDLLPGLACAAHFVIKAKQPVQGIDEYVMAGRALQRFWLTATQLGLLLQPEMTPLIFDSYLRQGIKFTSEPGIEAAARRLQGDLGALVNTDSNTPVYMGRIGAGRAPRARSLRKPLGDLMR